MPPVSFGLLQVSQNHKMMHKDKNGILKINKTIITGILYVNAHSGAQCKYTEEPQLVTSQSWKYL